jgi:murein DD-endopeptidase MepM/ murein hydrolase activator NlpD
MALIKSYPFSKVYPVGTKKFYSSGAGHYAYDYLTPMGVHVLAVRNGFIIDCNDGEPDNAKRRYSGMPSNWILLGYKNILGQKRTVYYQHLMEDSLLVKKGQKVKAGQWIAKTGNSGNSSWPHCHIHAMKGWQTRATRYANYNSKIRIYPPSLVWKKSSL